MSLTRDLAIALTGGIAGLLVSGGLGWTGSREGPTREPADRSRTVTTAATQPVFVRPKASVAVPVADCDEAIQSALAQDDLRRRLLATGQIPMDWPDDVPSRYREAHVGERLLEIVADHPSIGDLELDCAEFPCIAYLDLPEADLDDTNDQLEHLRLLIEDLERVWPDVKNRRRVSCDNEGCSTHLHFGPTARVDEAVETRMEVRRDDHASRAP